MVQARRLGLGNLPGYEALCLRREQLRPGLEQVTGTVLDGPAMATLDGSRWTQLDWCSTTKRDGRTHSLRLLPQQLIAVTGPSGCGKTTLLDQISELRDEKHSTWTITCGRDRWQLSGPAGARQLHQLMACAPQHAALFEASLRDNLLLGRELPDATIEAWLQRLGLGHLLDRPDGLEAPMALAQSPFSGGEIHRLGLLRAWLRERPVEVIQERSRQRLVLVSSHDPDLLNVADVVIDLGRVAARS